MSMASGGLFRELRRRHVFRVAAAYAVIGWLLIQIATQVFPVFAFPTWIEQLVVVLILIGFPIAVVLAWAFDATPQGIVRTDGSGGSATLSPARSRRAGVALAVIGIVIALIAGGAYWRFDRGVHRVSPSHASAPVADTFAPSAKSIAVLPFVNMSGDPNNEYFSDGITEEILDALAQLPKLKVAARTSAFAFKGKAEDLRKVGEALDVATVLEGSVQKSGDEVRITAQLIDTRSGYHLWSEKYDRKLTSIFAVEDEISKAIADKLQVEFAGAGAQSLIKPTSVDPRAHDFYLRGLTLLAARSVSAAVDAFQQATIIDPHYAQGWAALAEAEALLPAYSPVSMQEANERSLSASQRALALDPETALAYVAQGMVYESQMHWADADHALQRALALAPGDAEALDQYAQFLLGVGQLAPALAQLDLALQRDPLDGVSAAIRIQLRHRLHLDDADATATQIKALLSTHPDSLFVHRNALLIYLSIHRYPDAEAQARAVAILEGVDPEARVLLVRGMADPAMRSSALESLETSPDNAGMRRDPIVHALFLMDLGARDQALDALEQFAVSGNGTSQLLWFPDFDPIRNDPRYKAVLKKVGLPYVGSATSSRH